MSFDRFESKLADAAEDAQAELAFRQERHAKEKAAADSRRRRDLSPLTTVVGVVVGLIIIAGATYWSYQASRPPFPQHVMLINLQEKEEGGLWELTGQVRNGSRHAESKKYSVMYEVEGNPKPAVTEDLKFDNIKSMEIRDFKLEIPGYRQGMKRVIRMQE